MNKVVFLHIGVPRTGSTSLQRTLYQSADLLRSRGIDYPKVGVQKGAHVNLTLELGRPHAKLRFDETLGTWADMRAHIEDAPYGKFIISCEAFASFSDEQVAEVSRRQTGIDTRIVFFVRNQVDAFTSVYHQMQKRREVSAEHVIRKMLRLRNYDYQLLHDRWAKHFGGSAIHPLIYERCRADTLQAFLSVVDGNLNPDRFPRLKENQSAKWSPFTRDQIEEIEAAFIRSNRQFEKITGPLPACYVRSRPDHETPSKISAWKRFFTRTG